MLHVVRFLVIACFSTVMFTTAGLSPVSVVHADDDEVFREQLAQKKSRELHELMKDGKADEIRKIQAEMHEMMQTRARASDGTRITVRTNPNPSEQRERMVILSDLIQKSNELRKAGKIDEANEVMSEIRRMSQASRPERPAIPEEKKIDHLHLAAENLEAGGFQEEARELHERAEAMRRELERHRQAEQRAHGPHNEALEQLRHELTEQVQDLRREVQRLNTELQELRKAQAISNQQRPKLDVNSTAPEKRQELR